MRKKCALKLLTGVMVLTLAAASADLAQAEGNQVFYRGGWVGMTSDRANEVFTDVNGGVAGVSGKTNDGGAGYYVGGGLDLLMHKNFLGFKGMSLLGEIGVEYKHLDSNTVVVAVPSTCRVAGITSCTVTTDRVQITMLTVDIAPKLKFMDGSAFRPWIIPIGLDFHVISPPSNSTTVLDIGVQFGAGAEYNFWGPLNLGIDARYHLASNQTNTVNSYGTAGAYLGILY